MSLGKFKKPSQSSPVINTDAPTVAVVPERVRGSVQTVRMDEELVKALKTAAMDRNMSQQDIIIKALRHDLGLSL